MLVNCLHLIYFLQSWCFCRLTNILEFVWILTNTGKVTNGSHHISWICIQVKMIVVMDFIWNVPSITTISIRDNKKEKTREMVNQDVFLRTCSLLFLIFLIFVAALTYNTIEHHKVNSNWISGSYPCDATWRGKSFRIHLKNLKITFKMKFPS